MLPENRHWDEIPNNDFKGPRLRLISVGEVSSSSISTVSSTMHIRFGTQENKQNKLFIDHHVALQLQELCFSDLMTKFGDSMSNGDGNGRELVRVDK